MNTVKARVQYEPDDFVRAIAFIRSRSWFYRNRIQITIVALIALLLISFGLLIDPSDEINWLGLIPLTLFPSAVLGGMMWLLGRTLVPKFNSWYIRRQINKSPLLQEENEVELSETGFVGSTFFGGTNYKWEAFVEAHETDSDLHFFTSPKTTVFIPKRGFENETDIEQVKYFVKEKLGEKARF